MQPPVSGLPDRRFKTGRVQTFGINRIDTHVIDVLVLIEYRPPVLAAIFRQVDSTTFAMLPNSASPRCKIESLRRLWIDRQTVRSIDPSRKSDWLPMFGTIRRAIEGAISGVANTSVFRTSRQKHIESAVRA